jgi:hypothetical protein
MAALELAQSALADTPVPKKFLDGLVGKGYLTEENKQGILDDEELCRFITKGRARKASAKKVSDEERDNAEYDPLRCPCRIWKPLDGCGDVAKGMNIQCSKKLPDDMSMCKMHSGKLDEDGLWWLGLVTEDPPAQPFFQPGKKKAHYWSLDAKEDGKEKKKSLKEKQVSEDLEATKKAKKKKVVQSSSSEEEQEDPESEEDNASGCGFPPPHPEGVEAKRRAAKKKVSKELGDMNPSEMSMGELQALMAAKKMMDGKKSSKKEDEEDGEEEEEEEEEKLFEYEGVGYKITPEGEIIDDDYNYMGEHDGDGGIEFADDEAVERHEEYKKYVHNVKAGR